MPKKEAPRFGGMVGKAQGNLGGRRAQLDAAIDAQTGAKPRPAMKSTPIPSQPKPSPARSKLGPFKSNKRK